MDGRFIEDITYIIAQAKIVHTENNKLLPSLQSKPQQILEFKIEKNFIKSSVPDTVGTMNKKELFIDVVIAKCRRYQERNR